MNLLWADCHICRCQSSTSTASGGNHSIVRGVTLYAFVFQSLGGDLDVSVWVSSLLRLEDSSSANVVGASVKFDRHEWQMNTSLTQLRDD